MKVSCLLLLSSLSLLYMCGLGLCHFIGLVCDLLLRGGWGLTPSTQSNLFPKLTSFFYVENHKVSTSIRGGFHVLLHKTFLEQVHSARSSCTADARPLNGFENGPNVAESRIEHVLLTTWDGNSIFSSANRARPSSQKLPLNGFTEWIFLRNKEKAYQNRE